MAVLLGSVWLADGQVLISNHRDYHKVLVIARRLEPGARVRYMPEHMIPRHAEPVIVVENLDQDED